MNHLNFIDALGGSAVVGARLGICQSTVSNWRTRGVPWAYRPALAAWARQRRIVLPEGFLRTLPPAARQGSEHAIRTPR